MGFKVDKILNANTVSVSPMWKIGEVESAIVRVSGFENVDKNTETLARRMLEILILNKEIELKKIVNFNAATPTDIASGITQPILLCAVYLEGVDISEYFHQLQGAS